MHSLLRFAMNGCPNSYLKKLSFKNWISSELKHLMVSNDAFKAGMGVTVHSIAKTNDNTLVSHLAFSKSILILKALGEVKLAVMYMATWVIM